MLWLCLHFPQLPLEIHSRAETAASPWALSEGKATRRSILLCNHLAAACGIHPGMAAGAAYALAATLRLRERDEAAERQALESLAAWAMQFTSLVSLLPPLALLLEIEGSLHLFKGLDALLRRVRRHTMQLGYVIELGVAPTPLAAWLLARRAQATPVTRLEALSAALRDLPLALLDLDDKQLHRLHGLGLRSIGELLRLPRAGLARRFGLPLLDHLDRLLGLRADPRLPYQPPPRFQQRVLLPAETWDSEALLFAARRLLLELAGMLTGRHAGTQQLHWTLGHPRRPATSITLGLAAPNRDPQHFLHLLRERLTRTTLAHPVESIGLEVTDLRPLEATNLTLDGTQSSAALEWPQLMERLRARLGDEAVQGLQSHPDHRPEQAWRSVSPGATTAYRSHSPRPLWLLPDPLPLESRGGTPCLGERLYIEAGPERIESGWWDGGGVARDYFIARDGACARYWLFRERAGERRWFLHGLFA